MLHIGICDVLAHKFNHYENILIYYLSGVVLCVVLG